MNRHGTKNAKKAFFNLAFLATWRLIVGWHLGQRGIYKLMNKSCIIILANTASE